MVEHGVLAYFAAEMLTKMLAMGVWGSKAYLGDGWNCFDCFIVIVGLIEYFFVEGGEVNFSAIRAFRVFRPLRAIKRIPGLRLLVTLLFDILPMLGNVLIFCLFIFFVFGIGGVQLWSGTLRHRCYFPRNTSDAWPKPPVFMPTYYRTTLFDFVCSPDSGMLQCNQIEIYEKNQESMCTELFDGNVDEMAECQRWIPYYTDCRPDGPNPLQGTLSFDNIGLACIAIFQVISLEGWTEIMYIMQDAYSFWVWIYFVVLIMVGSQFAVNLCLVVIATQFSETKKREMATMKLERRTKAASLSKMSLSMGASSVEELSLYNQLLNLVMHFGMLTYHRLAMAIKSRRNENTTLTKGRRRRIDHDDDTCAKSLSCFLKEKNGKLRAILRRILEHNIGVGFITGAIILNMTVMGAEYDRQPETFTRAIEIINFIFTIFFTIELLIKIYAYGFYGYIRDGFNTLDLIIVVINLAELQQGGGSNLSVLRTFRLVRVVKIIRFLPSLQHSLLVMMRTIDNIAPFFVLLSFFLYIFALLGMSLFGCRFCPQAATASNHNHTTADIMGTKRCYLAVVESEKDTNETLLGDDLTKFSINISSTTPQATAAQQPCSRSNFDSLLTSVFTVLQVFTQDAWSAVLKDGMRNTSEFASLYFVALVTIGNYVIFNLLVAILVEGFASEQVCSLVFFVFAVLFCSPTGNKRKRRLLGISSKPSGEK